MDPEPRETDLETEREKERERWEKRERDRELGRKESLERASSCLRVGRDGVQPSTNKHRGKTHRESELERQWLRDTLRDSLRVRHGDIDSERQRG